MTQLIERHLSPQKQLRYATWLRLYLLLSLFSVALLCNKAFAYEPVELTSATKHLTLTSQMSVLVDPSGTLSLNEATSSTFIPRDKAYSEGFTRDTYWYRFTITSRSSVTADWILSMGEPYLDHVQVWIINEQGEYQLYPLGDHTPIHLRPLKTPDFALHFSLLPEESKQVYIRVNSTSSINFTAEIWSLDAFIDNQTTENLYNGIFFGAMGMIAMTFLFFGVWLNIPGMVVYVIYLGCVVALYLGMHGYTAVLFTPDQSWISDLFVGAGIVGGSSAVLFMWALLLNYKQHFPSLHKLYLLVGSLSLCALPLVITPYYRFVAPISNYLLLIFTAITIVTQYLLWQRLRQLEFGFYLISDLFLAAGYLFQIGTVLGWFPQVILDFNPLQIASFIHILIVSFGLSLIIRRIQTEKVLAEQDATHSKDRAEEQRRFVAMLSHEFRTPLAAIDRAAQMLHFTANSHNENQVERIHNIRSRVTSLNALVDNFLVSEALDHQALSLNPSECDITALIERVISTLGDHHRERITTVITPSHAKATLDTNLLEMAIGNLLSNALHYSPEQSPVVITASIDTHRTSVTVTDHGPGLSQEELSFLGQPYYRATTSVGKKGSGLGYHFTRRIVEAHQGELIAQSLPEQGLSVTIVIPNQLDDNFA